MMEKVGTSTPAQKAIAEARAEIEQEAIAKGKKRLISKLRDLKAAETVVANLKREIEDIEEAINQGNEIE